MTDQDSDAALRATAERRADAKIGFRVHATIFVLVNGFLAALNLLTTPRHLWFYWPLLGWGIGLAAHAFGVYAEHTDMRERAIEAELKRLRERR